MVIFTLNFHRCCDPDACLNSEIDGSPRSPVQSPSADFPQSSGPPPDHPSQTQIREPFLLPKCPVWRRYLRVWSKSLFHPSRTMTSQISSGRELDPEMWTLNWGCRDANEAEAEGTKTIKESPTPTSIIEPPKGLFWERQWRHLWLVSWTTFWERVLPYQDTTTGIFKNGMIVQCNIVQFGVVLSN